MTVHKEKTCACGHAASFHDKRKGRCLYGHDRERFVTTVAPCPCAKFHRRSSAAALYMAPESSSADIEALSALDDIIRGLTRLRAAIARGAPVVTPALAVVTPSSPAPTTPMVERTRKRFVSDHSDGWRPGRCELALLNVLAQRVGVQTSAVQLATLSGYSFTSSSFTNALSALRSHGAAHGGRDDVQATPLGAKLVPTPTPLPTGAKLLELWCAKVDKAQRTLLRVIWDEHPLELSKALLSDRSGYSLTSSTFANALSGLRSLALVERGSTRLGPGLASSR